MPSRPASRLESSTHISGAARSSCGARRVFVRVWKWYAVRPVVSNSGYSSSGCSWGAVKCADFNTALPFACSAAWSLRSKAAPVSRSWP